MLCTSIDRFQLKFNYRDNIMAFPFQWVYVWKKETSYCTRIYIHLEDTQYRMTINRKIANTHSNLKTTRFLTAAKDIGYTNPNSGHRTKLDYLRRHYRNFRFSLRGILTRTYHYRAKINWAFSTYERGWWFYRHQTRLSSVRCTFFCFVSSICSSTL